MTEFRVNKFITLVLEGKDTVIYVAGKRFQQCKYLFLTIPVDDLDRSEGVESIDEAAEELDISTNPKYNKYTKISPEEEFWAHCSNIQTFFENNYNSKILHRNLAFPLLKKLYEAGDRLAVKVFKEEIAQRLSSTHQNTVLFLLEDNYQLYLTPEEFDIVYQNLSSDKEELIKNFIRGRFNDAKSDNELLNRLFDYINVMCSDQELQEYHYVTYKEKRYFVRKGGLIINGERNTINNISEIKGWSKLKGLKKLYIERTLITSTEGLEGLNQLEHLDLSRNKVKTIKGLEALINLKSLDLAYNQIEKISGLETLRKLEELTLGANKIVEINGLESLKSLKRLDLTFNLIEEIKGLKALRDLKFLSLNNNNISKIKGLDNLEHLEYLNLYGNKITEIEGLNKLKKLKSLRLERNQIIEMKGLDNLNNLMSLDLGYNQISEMKGLGSLHKLKELTLEHDQIREMKGLDGLRNLCYINLRNNQIYKVHKIEGYMSLDYINLDNNKLIGSLNRVFDGYEDLSRIID